jgi:hypothetical protein
MEITLRVKIVSLILLLRQKKKMKNTSEMNNLVRNLEKIINFNKYKMKKK